MDGNTGKVADNVMVAELMDRIYALHDKYNAQIQAAPPASNATMQPSTPNRIAIPTNRDVRDASSTSSISLSIAEHVQQAMTTTQERQAEIDELFEGEADDLSYLAHFSPFGDEEEHTPKHSSRHFLGYPTSMNSTIPAPSPNSLDDSRISALILQSPPTTDFEKTELHVTTNSTSNPIMRSPFRRISPTESELATQGFEFHNALTEDMQIQRFNDKAFRKALREVKPELPRKLQWYAWNKVCQMLSNDTEGVAESLPLDGNTAQDRCRTSVTASNTKASQLQIPGLEMASFDVWSNLQREHDRGTNRLGDSRAADATRSIRDHDAEQEEEDPQSAAMDISPLEHLPPSIIESYKSRLKDNSPTGTQAHYPAVATQSPHIRNRHASSLSVSSIPSPLQEENHEAHFSVAFPHSNLQKGSDFKISTVPQRRLRPSSAAEFDVFEDQSSSAQTELDSWPSVPTKPQHLSSGQHRSYRYTPATDIRGNNNQTIINSSSSNSETPHSTRLDSLQTAYTSETTETTAANSYQPRPDTPRPFSPNATAVRQSIEREVPRNEWVRESTPAYTDRSPSPSPQSIIGESVSPQQIGIDTKSQNEDVDMTKDETAIEKMLSAPVPSIFSSLQLSDNKYLFGDLESPQPQTDHNARSFQRQESNGSRRDSLFSSPVRSSFPSSIRTFPSPNRTSTRSSVDTSSDRSDALKEVLEQQMTGGSAYDSVPATSHRSSVSNGRLPTSFQVSNDSYGFQYPAQTIPEIRQPETVGDVTQSHHRYNNDFLIPPDPPLTPTVISFDPYSTPTPTQPQPQSQSQPQIQIQIPIPTPPAPTQSSEYKPYASIPIPPILTSTHPSSSLETLISPPKRNVRPNKSTTLSHHQLPTGSHDSSSSRITKSRSRSLARPHDTNATRPQGRSRSKSRSRSIARDRALNLVAQRHTANDHPVVPALPHTYDPTEPTQPHIPRTNPDHIDTEKATLGSRRKATSKGNVHRAVDRIESQTTSLRPDGVDGSTFEEANGAVRRRSARIKNRRSLGVEGN